jgi:hypothetical protein
MRNEFLLKSKVKKSVKIFLIFYSIIAAILAIVSVDRFFEDGKIIQIFVVSIPVFVFAIITYVWVLKKTIAVGHSFIKSTSIRTKIIKFDNLDRIGIYKNHIELMSGKIKISINTDIEKQYEIIDYILKNIDFNSEKIKITGNSNEIDKWTKVKLQNHNQIYN